MFANVLDQIKTDLGKNSQLGNEHHLKGKKTPILEVFRCSSFGSWFISCSCFYSWGGFNQIFAMLHPLSLACFLPKKFWINFSQRLWSFHHHGVAQATATFNLPHHEVWMWSWRFKCIQAFNFFSGTPKNVQGIQGIYASKSCSNPPSHLPSPVSCHCDWQDDELLYGIRSWAAQQLNLPTDVVEPLQMLDEIVGLGKL